MNKPRRENEWNRGHSSRSPFDKRCGKKQCEIWRERGGKRRGRSEERRTWYDEGWAEPLSWGREESAGSINVPALLKLMAHSMKEEVLDAGDFPDWKRRVRVETGPRTEASHDNNCAVHLQTRKTFTVRVINPCYCCCWSGVILRAAQGKSRIRGAAGPGSFIRNASLGAFEPSNSRAGIRSLVKKTLNHSLWKKRGTCESKSLINANVSGALRFLMNLVEICLKFLLRNILLRNAAWMAASQLRLKAGQGTGECC